MIWFSYTYVGSRLLVMDVQEDRTPGYRTFVASLSEDPRVSFRSLSAHDALARLTDFLHGPRIIFLREEPIGAPCLERSGT
ncbi:MAG: hypothetical protein JWM80_2234 [Cyanobacteria bacterium RYN_339]|nr:hypothetical protein [Cyanobacteria bacterium RYN_339]